MIEIKGLSKMIEDKYILKEINLKVNKGSIFGLIGPNGAGKSTLIRCLTGIYRLEEGEILYEGQSVYENIEVKNKIGYVADENNFFSTFKLIDIINYYKLAYKNFDEEKFKELNKEFKMNTKKRFFQLSKGNKMKFAIMMAMCIHPEYLILDEPTSGIDPIFKRKFLEILLNEVAEKGTTVIISSHNLSNVERICDTIAILNNGKVTAVSSIDDMKNKIKKLQVAFKVAIKEEELKIHGVVKVENVGRVYNIVTTDYGAELIHKINSLNPLFVEELDLSLEDIFIYTIEGEGK
ncbi:ABC-2 type transport system ATP-binding protein [Clostridium pascui]|uniref:ABC transporter ATP-binding protein n=1 Tax=Clostridium pascui TaxID=46609 RepID=UPI00195C685F|nr:ABC transporter ATP-binding protein [Clostridium pascui]MBM7872277.1 ABC-2 type transport system ATP-binding protein [Clostridium pascui]